MDKTIENNIVLQNCAVQITALSATALLVGFGNAIDLKTNNKVTELYHQLQQNNLPWIIELIPAYCSLGIVYNLPFIKLNNKPNGLVFDWVKHELTAILQHIRTINITAENTIEIPICFEPVLPNDLQIIAHMCNLPANKTIDLFLHRTYHVFMLGFLPGFAYMGQVDNKIAMPRKNNAMPVNAGAVGITGVQAGIYPWASPGGWHIIGHTPFGIFNVNNSPPNLLKAGDSVRFKMIPKELYVDIKNEQRF